MLRQDKETAVADLKRRFEEAGAYFITDYQGLNVRAMTGLRKNLSEKNVTFLIAKNTLIKLAAKSAGQEGIDDHLTGPTAVAFSSDDPSVAAKILHESYKAHELPRIKVFVVEGQLHGAEDMKRLADLPTRDVLLSQVVASVEAPFAELVGSLDGFFRDLVGSIDALEEKRKSEA